MTRILLLSEIMAISLFTLASADDCNIPKPCHVQSIGDQLRCAVPDGGYKVRSGDCPGNDIWALYRGNTTLEECAHLCSSRSECQAFMFYNNQDCNPKSKTCVSTDKSNPLNVFYDKVPSRYTMRPGDCPGNDISYLFRGDVTRQECAQLCDSSSACNAFMHDDSRVCYPKKKGCGITSLAYSLNIFYDKVPKGYSLRPGDCPGNDILGIRGSVSLSECANRCNSDANCISFMYSDGECYPKTRTCAQPSTNYPKDVFYDKVPEGYAMRLGECPGNEILSAHGLTSLEECARRCSNHPECVSFMFSDGFECYPKTRTCQTTDKGNPKNFFYDKIAIIFYHEVPEGYSVRPGDCPRNDLWELSGYFSLSECANFCNSEVICVAFLYSDGKQCFPKVRTCAQPSTNYPNDVFYDKVPKGYAMRPGDCPGNDIHPSIHGLAHLEECARRCSNRPECVSFLFSDGRVCYPKTRTCAQPSLNYPTDVYYDKVPSGYTMRPGDCPGNEILSIEGVASLEECARRCNNHPECVAFMFFDGRVCYPKTKSCQTTDKGNPKNFFYYKIAIV